ncbi:hypothetical protein IJ670_07020 [bacterium]|nr:hypothetical protein [bacterium]
MAIGSIGSFVKTLPRKALNGINSVGASTINCAKQAGDTFSKCVPDVVKQNKKTIVGAGVVGVAISSLTALTLGIINKIKNNN